jgi:phytoene dehydrogenase-like protein
MHDLIVIGDDISSYIAAAVAVKYGLDTVHIAQHKLEEMSIDGIYFNADPSVITELGKGQTASALLKELKIDAEDTLYPQNDHYQVVLPDNRIDFFSNKDDLISDFVREFPSKNKDLLSFYKAAEKNAVFFKKWLSDHPFFQISGFKKYFNYFKLLFNLIIFRIKRKKYRRTLFNNPTLRKIFEAQLGLLSSDIEAFESFSSSYHFTTPLRGVYRLEKNKSSLTETLLEYFRDNGGKYLNNCKLQSIRKPNFVNAEVIDEQKVVSIISAENLVISNKSEGLKLFYKKKKKIKTDKWLKRTKVTHYPLTLHFVISEKCLPEKMSSHVALVTDISKDIYDDNLILLEINSPDKGKKTTIEKKVLTATVFLPADDKNWKRANLILAADSVIERVEYLVPFLKENIKYYDVNKSIDLSMKYRTITNPKYRVKKSFFSGFSAQKNKTSLKKVYLTGASLFTDIGCWEGEIISGMYAVYSVLKDRGK